MVHRIHIFQNILNSESLQHKCLPFRFQSIEIQYHLFNLLMHIDNIDLLEPRNTPLPALQQFLRYQPQNKLTLQSLAIFLLKSQYLLNFQLKFLQ
jgi:hypothetical protein